MTGRSPLSATGDQVAGLRELSGSDVRGEADRARAILLTLSGWTGVKVAEAWPDAVSVDCGDAAPLQDRGSTATAVVSTPMHSEAMLRLGPSFCGAPGSEIRSRKRGGHYLPRFTRR